MDAGSHRPAQRADDDQDASPDDTIDAPHSKMDNDLAIDAPSPNDENDIGGQSFQTEMDEVDQAIALGADPDHEETRWSTSQDNTQENETRDEYMNLERPSSTPGPQPVLEQQIRSTPQLSFPPTHTAEETTLVTTAERSPPDITDSVILQRDAVPEKAVETVEGRESNLIQHREMPRNDVEQPAPQNPPTSSTGLMANKRRASPNVSTPVETQSAVPTDLSQSQNSTLDPSLLFAGLRFLVDPKRPNRTQLLRSIQKAGGKIVADYSEATHVLVHGFATSSSVDRDHWRQIMGEVVPQGVWFLFAQWALKSLEMNRHLPESDFHLPGGAPDMRDVKPILARPLPDSQAEGSQTAAKKARLPLAQILQTFEINKALLADSTDQEAGVFLARNVSHLRIHGVIMQCADSNREASTHPKSGASWSVSTAQKRVDSAIMREMRIRRRAQIRLTRWLRHKNPEKLVQLSPKCRRIRRRTGQQVLESHIRRPVWRTSIRTRHESCVSHTSWPSLPDGHESPSWRAIDLRYETSGWTRGGAENQTSIQDAALWARWYDEYQRREGFSQHTDAELVALFKGCAAKTQEGSTKKLNSLLETVGPRF